MNDSLDDAIKALEYWGRVGKSLQGRFMPTISLTPKHIELLNEQLKRHREGYQHRLEEMRCLREENRILRDKLRAMNPPTNPIKQP